MAKVISTEKSPYINKQIEIYAKNKVGQFSKYLQKNPVFVTYYGINQQMSRADVGLGSVKEEIGAKSPIRYNEIKEFPVYNLPDLKPDVTFDEERGMDVDMDLSGIVILPNTVKPVGGDYIYFKLPGMNSGVLLRVNNFEFNTIQSNDYYTIDCELRAVIDDTNLNNTFEQLKKQVAEKYTCVFDNIGTADKCLVKDDDYILAKKIANFIEVMKESYYETYYHQEVGTFAAFGNSLIAPTYFYDLNVIKFLKDTDLFYDSDGYRVVALSYDDILPMNFERKFHQTIWHAVLKQDSKYLKPYSYYSTNSCMKTTSPFKMLGRDTNCQVARLELLDTAIPPESSEILSGFSMEYFPLTLTMALRGLSELPADASYFSQLMYNYINSIPQEIDMDKIMDQDMNESVRNYIDLPIIIFILMQTYNSIFSSSHYDESIK